MSNNSANIDDARELILRMLDRKSIKALLAQVTKLTDQVNMLQIVIVAMMSVLHQRDLLSDLPPELRAYLDTLSRKSDPSVEQASPIGKDYRDVNMTNFAPPIVVDCTGLSVEELASTIAYRIFENTPSNMPEEMEAQVFQRAHEIATEIIARRDASRRNNGK